MSLLDEDVFGFAHTVPEVAPAACSMLLDEPQQQHISHEYLGEDDAVQSQAIAYGGQNEYIQTAMAPLQDPFAYEPPCSPLPPQQGVTLQHPHQQPLDYGEAESMQHTMPQLKHEADLDFEIVSPPPIVAGAYQEPMMMTATSPLKYAGAISNAHVPQRQNISPNAPRMLTSYHAAAANADAVKREPLSPTSHVTSPRSRVSSPNMPHLLHGAPVSSPSQTPVLGSACAARCDSLSGSGSAGSGGSGANSAAHSCSSNSGSDSDDSEASFDEEHVVAVAAAASASNKKGKKAAAGSAKKGQAGRKRKNKAGGNSSDAAAAAGDADVNASALLDEHGQALPPMLGADGVPVEGNKRQQRLQRNRASAQLSRERKKQYMRLLEKQLGEMAEVNTGLVEQVRALTGENTALKQRLASLSMRERVAARYGNGNARPSQQLSQQPQQHMLPSQYASSQASTASLRGGDDSSSLGSHPSTPSTGGAASGDVELPQAKRLRVAPASPGSASAHYGGQQQRSAGTFSNARAGMLLFTLVMSVGLLYNSLGGGVDVGQVQVPTASVPTSAGFDLPAVAASAASAVLGRALPSRAGRVLASVASSTPADDAYALVPAGGRATVELVEDESAVEESGVAAADMTDDDTSKALNVYSELAAAAVAAGGARNHLSAHADHGAPLLQHGDLALLRRLLFSTMAGANNSSNSNGSSNVNASSLATQGSQYMFCPHSLSISRDAWTDMLHKHGLVVNSSSSGKQQGEELDEKQLVVAGSSSAKRSRSGKKKTGAGSRLRKVIGLPALPAPGEEGGPAVNLDSTLLLSELAGLPAVQSSLQVGDKLLLWVPLQLQSDSSPQQQNATVAPEESNGTTKQALVEIACHISHVRPIVLS